MQDLIERLVALQPHLERVLDVRLPPWLRDELGAVTEHQLAALEQLPQGGRTMREFADGVGISGAAATDLADRLVARGLAERREDPADRRTVRLLPTGRGLAIHQACQAWRRQRIATVLRRLTADQLTSLVRILAALAAPPPGQPGDATEAGAPRSCRPLDPTELGRP